ALYALAIAPVALFATWPFAELLRRRMMGSRTAGATATSALEEGVANIVAVQTQAAESRERARFDRESLEAFRRHRGMIAVAMVAILCAFVPGIAVIRGVFLEVVDLAIAGRISLGDVSVLVTWFVQIAVFCGYLGGMWFTLGFSAPGLERVFALLDEE